MRGKIIRKEWKKPLSQLAFPYQLRGYDYGGPK
jgi:hypothetical protein